MEHFVRVYQLYDFYGDFLTAKQQKAVELYFGHDLSLAEIADEMGTSRQAVHDLLRRSEQILETFEAKLGLAQRYEKEQRCFSELEALLRQLEDSDSRWQRVFQLLAEVRE